MGLLCSLLGHRRAGRILRNRGVLFGRCRRCGVGLVRTERRRWHVPAGYRIIWPADAPEERPEPPRLALPAFSPEARQPDVRPFVPWSETAAPATDPPQDEGRSDGHPAMPTTERAFPQPDPMIAPEPPPSPDLIASIEEPAASPFEEPAPTEVDRAPMHAAQTVIVPDFMADDGNEEFWNAPLCESLAEATAAAPPASPAKGRKQTI